eukprot:NODE_66_length_25735_cov_0.318497.p21 type:complete len:145 gc:universal NODE_66_length_25735_cov_0.318497:10086-10520(+)
MDCFVNLKLLVLEHIFTKSRVYNVGQNLSSGNRTRTGLNLKTIKQVSNHFNVLIISAETRDNHGDFKVIILYMLSTSISLFNKSNWTKGSLLIFNHFLMAYLISDPFSSSLYNFDVNFKIAQIHLSWKISNSGICLKFLNCKLA